jgi:hypothetical protein
MDGRATRDYQGGHQWTPDGVDRVVCNTDSCACGVLRGWSSTLKVDIWRPGNRPPRPAPSRVTQASATVSTATTTAHHRTHAPTEPTANVLFCPLFYDISVIFSSLESSVAFPVRFCGADTAVHTTDKTIERSRKGRKGHLARTRPCRRDHLADRCKRATIPISNGNMYSSDLDAKRMQ